MNLGPRSVLLPIDNQRGFSGPLWHRHQTRAADSYGLRLLDCWRTLAFPIIHIKHDSIDPSSPLRPGHPGNAFRPGFGPLQGEGLVSKSVNAAFIGTDLELRLRRLDVQTVVLFGYSIDMCVSTTARVASNLGYRTIVVADASACADIIDAHGRIHAADLARAHLATLNNEFADVVNTDDVIRALSVLQGERLLPKQQPCY